MKLVIPDFIELLDDDKAKLSHLGEVTLYEDLPGSEVEVIQRLAGAELIIPSVIDVTATVIRSTPSLKYIIVPGIGYDQIDVKAARAAGIKVLNCPTHNVAAVAEYTIGLILAVTRRIVESHLTLQQGRWNSQVFRGVEVRGKKLGLIGYGNIGKAVETLAIALGMEVTHSTSSTSAADLDALISSADFLSLHLPLTAQTRSLIDERRLGLMKPTAFLINTARGAIVDQSALFKALQAKRIAGAALDVFAGEPIGGEATADIRAFATLANVVATSHIAYNTYETAVRLAEELFTNIQSCLSNQPINVVN